MEAAGAAAAGRYFTTLPEYLAWFEARRELPRDAPRVGLLLYRKHVVSNPSPNPTPSPNLNLYPNPNPDPSPSPNPDPNPNPNPGKHVVSGLPYIGELVRGWHQCIWRVSR